MLPLVLVGLLLLVLAGLLVWQVRRRNVDRWLRTYIAQTPRRCAPRADEEVHLLLCIADHWEPRFQSPPDEVARRRVQRWVEEYPRRFSAFRDSDGRSPRHTFFYPAEEYDPEFLEMLTELCAAGHGEVELHLHHDDDTGENFRRTLSDFRDTLAQRHGLLARNKGTGAVRYAFIHGNWALCNSRPDGRYCGVNEELAILRETGCYADLTMPSAPSPTQTRKINALYYGVDIPGRARSHESGVDVGTGSAPEDGLMLIQGPLMLDWGRRKWGLLPRLENSCLQGSQPPTMARLDLWLRARVQVPTRPDWFFVKLHGHGAEDASIDLMLGEAMVQFHRDLAERASKQAHFHFHYVTARELYNLIRAAEAGWQGSVADALDFELVPGPALPPAERTLAFDRSVNRAKV